MSESAVTVCIPSIPPRTALLDRARRSVERQTRPADRVVIEIDDMKTGAAATRQRALDRVRTPFVAFLDDDDELFPRHLELLIETQVRTGADLVYPWFEVEGGTDPFSDRYGVPFDADALRLGQFIPITVLARTESVRDAGGFQEMPAEWGGTNEDYRLWLSMLDHGATFAHLPRITWTWHHWGGNTSGKSSRW